MTPRVVLKRCEDASGAHGAESNRGDVSGAHSRIYRLVDSRLHLVSPLPSREMLPCIVAAKSARDDI